MGVLTLNSSWNAFNPSTGVVMSASEFKKEWLWGIPTTSNSGAVLSDWMINNKIQQSQAFVENLLTLKLFKQYIIEVQDFIAEDFYNWGYIKTNYQMNDVLSLVGRFNEQQIIQYPKEWLTISRGNNTTNAAKNNLYIVPNGMGNVNVTYLAISMTQYFGFHNARIIPNYWQIGYCTGFDIIPPDIMRLIALITVIDLLLVIELGVGVLGGGGTSNSISFGMASTSLSLDGMSQSVSRMNGGNIFQNRIRQSYEEVKSLMTQLRYAYGGITFDVA